MASKINWRSILSPQLFLLAIGFALLTGISTATVVLVNRASNDALLLAETLSVQNKLSNVLLSARRAESSQRGFLFTGNAAYLDDYAAEPEARKLIADLLQLTKANPTQQAMLRKVATLIDQKFAEMAQTIAHANAARHDEARNEVVAGTGRAIMNEIRDVIEKAVADETRIAAERSNNSRTTNTLLLIVTLVGAGLIIFIGAISISLVQRNARQAEIARQELEGTNNNLERIVQYRTADLTEANNEIQRFAYIVSHDLRSPLVNIMGFTSELEALRNDIFAEIAKLTAEVAALNSRAVAADGKLEQIGADFDEAIRFIKTSIGNMDRLINAVLKLSREGRRQFNPQTIDMRALLEQISQTVNHRVMELGAALDVEDLPVIESDPLALEQIFANLIDNAIKYRRTDEPLRIRVRGRASSTQAVYDVEDNGRGIDPGDHQRVFELFRRSGKQDRPGEGIGLAHVRALVRRLGGTMELKSEIGKGSTFTVILPRQWSVLARKAV